MQVAEYRSLLLHMEWADALIWRSVLNASPSGQDDSMLGRLHHFHSTQWAYRCCGASRSRFRSSAPSPTRGPSAGGRASSTASCLPIGIRWTKES
jgi:hypothetical protein